MSVWKYAIHDGVNIHLFASNISSSLQQQLYNMLVDGQHRPAFDNM